jgi:hypothetical protein
LILLLRCAAGPLNEVIPAIPLYALKSHMGRTPSERPQRAELLRALRRAEDVLRGIAGRLHLPGADRLDLLRLANDLASILAREAGE